MSKVNLVLGSKRLSSWSLRPWLFLKHHGVPFGEIVVELDRPETRTEILKHSPSGRVPVMKLDDLLIWDSLAICEFAVEYADQNQRDYRAFVKAVREKRVQASIES